MTASQVHPKGLYLLFSVEIWERFSFYAARALLVLYMTALASQGGLEFTHCFSLKLYSYYLGFAYTTPILGGWLADRWIGPRYSLYIGGIFMLLGYLLMALSQDFLFYIALISVGIGNGFFKPNITAVLGRQYMKNDPRRDSGYAIFYMGINIGSILAGFGSAFMEQKYGFAYGFSAASLAMAIGLVVLYLGQGKVFNPKKEILPRREIGYADDPLTFVDKHRMIVIGFLVLAIFFFMAAFEQAGGLLNLYANNWTDRNWFGYQVPAALFQALNPFFVIILSPIFSWFWMRAAPHAIPSSLKVSLGLFLSSLGFMLIWFLTPSDVMETAHGCHSMWLVPYYGLVTAGEICILPVVWSAVSKLSPRKYSSSMMALALFASGLGSFAAGQIASHVDGCGPKEIFGLMIYTLLSAAVCLVVATPALKQWSHGVE